MTGAWADEVASLLRAAAARAIVPRYKALADGDVTEKSPGEIVTVADRDAEKIITDGLRALSPRSVVVGEEGCAENPAILERLGDESVWLVDPLDGTSNFAKGQPPFALMVGLLRKGVCVASWMLDPVSDRLFFAEQGGGAYENAKRIHTSQASPGANEMCGVIATRFMPPDMQVDMKARAQSIADYRPLMLCAGTEYPDVAQGDRHFVLYWRTLPWDHAPGALFLTEAGGRVARPDGSSYHLSDDRPGLLVARNAAVWDTAARMLFEHLPT